MERRSKRVCQKCGASFWGGTDSHYCPACAKEARADSVFKIRTCQDCGIEFFGGPRAKRCPDCALEAKRRAQREYKAKDGAKRPIGSTDRCVVCGAEYVVTSGRQKYCSDDCAREGVLAWQREHKKGYAQTSGQAAKKKAKRNKQERICVYCLRKFKDNRPTNTCSDFCREKQKEINQCKADIKRGYSRDMDAYEREREGYRGNVKEGRESK